MASLDVRKWLVAGGVELIPGVGPVKTEGRGYALESLYGIDVPDRDDNLEEGDEFDEVVAVQVPSDFTLNAQRITELAVSDPNLRQWIDADGCQGTELLHRGLLYLWLELKDNPWKDYLAFLPTDIDLPFSYSISDMQGLDFSAVSLRYAAMMKRLAIEKNYERFKRSEVGQRSGITLEQWLIPHRWISSRGLTHPLTGETTMVPGIDLCNHSSKSSNVRYDVDVDGNFVLKILPNTVVNECELTLNYGNRSTGEFVFNYGFIPDDRDDGDFDEILKAFDPMDDEIRNIFESDNNGKRNMEKAGDFYEGLCEVFDFPQVLRIIRLPREAVSDEKDRYRFNCNFIMAVAAFDQLEIATSSDGDQILLLDGQQVEPTQCFQTVVALGKTDIVAAAKRLVAKFSAHLINSLSQITSHDGLIPALARTEIKIYEEYAKYNLSAE